MKTSVGERFKLRREEIGMSARELAGKLSISLATYYRYEKGYLDKVDPAVIQDIAKILRVRPSYLMGWEDKVELEKPEIDLSNLKESIVTFDGEELSESDLNKIAKIITLTLED
ncbi:TPA: helix-turn-helix transcriptional regulator [Streptococcus suis]|nr:helix-turn-helix transcriptional regulator [Streptococcus suis]